MEFICCLRTRLQPFYLRIWNPVLYHNIRKVECFRKLVQPHSPLSYFVKQSKTAWITLLPRLSFDVGIQSIYPPFLPRDWTKCCETKSFMQLWATHFCTRLVGMKRSFWGGLLFSSAIDLWVYCLVFFCGCGVPRKSKQVGKTYKMRLKMRTRPFS